MQPSGSSVSVSPFRSLFRLALPIVGVNVGMMLMGSVDTVMVGRVSPEALAAVALGNVYSFAVMIFGVGVLLALDPILAQAHGAGESEGVAFGLQRGVVLAAVLAIPLSLAMLFAAPLLQLARQPADVIPLAAQYCLIIIPGILPFLLFNVVRQTLQVFERVAPVLWTILIANVLNVGLNRVLVFGAFGISPLGVAGSALATSLSRLLMIAILIWIARRPLLPLLLPIRPGMLTLAPFGAMLKIGIPIAFQFEIEIAAFSVVALLMGTFGTVQVAGHQVALSLASLTFMVPMGVGMAAAVQVGNGVGRGDPVAVRASARAALQIGAGFMCVTALLFLGLPRFFAGLYTNAPDVLAFAATLLPIAGIFQICDGLQVVCVGLLRGLGDTRAPMLINLLGFGVLGIGTSLTLAFKTSLGAIGLWWGLVMGLTVVAAILLLRLRVALRRPLKRVQ